MVLESYFKRFRVFFTAVAIVVGAAVTWRYWIAAPRTDAGLFQAIALFFVTFYITMMVVIIFGTIYVKRIFPPKLEDYEEYSKQAHYTPLSTARCWPTYFVEYFTWDLSLWDGVTSTSAFSIGTR
jgi:hypothetical protein